MAEADTAVETAISETAIPAEAELREALELLRDANEAVGSITFHVRKTAEVSGEEETIGAEPQGPVPTYEDIGRLYGWAREARLLLDEASDYITEIEQSHLGGLDYARVIRGGKEA